MKKHIKSYKNACHIMVFPKKKKTNTRRLCPLALEVMKHSGAGTVIKIHIGESGAMLSNKCAKEYHGQSGKHA